MSHVVPLQLVSRHAPPAHELPDGQTFPQVPQLLLSVLTFTHIVPHVRLSPPQMQLPCEQV
jgi:hypothetical protein